MKDVKIAYREPWRRTHWRTIHDAYGRSPWFEHYAPTLELLFTKRPEYLVDWNLETMRWVLKQLDWVGRLDVEGPNRDSVDSQARDLIDPGHLYRGDPLGPDECPYSYAQVFSDRRPFRGNLSILDLILCEGPSARAFLNGFGPAAGPVARVNRGA